MSRYSTDADYRLMDTSPPVMADGNQDDEKTEATGTDEVLLTRRCFMLRRPCWFAICCVAMAFFVAAAAVQHNDPDPHIWIPVYLAPVLWTIAILWAFSNSKLDGKVLKVLSTVVLCYILACAIGAAVLFWHLSNAEIEAHQVLVYEEGRELFGLLICCFWVAICYCTTLTLERRNSKPVIVLMICSSLLAVVPVALWSICLLPSAASSVHYCAAMVSAAHQNATQI